MSVEHSRKILIPPNQRTDVLADMGSDLLDNVYEHSGQLRKFTIRRWGGTVVKNSSDICILSTNPLFSTLEGAINERRPRRVEQLTKQIAQVLGENVVWSMAGRTFMSLKRPNNNVNYNGPLIPVGDNLVSASEYVQGYWSDDYARRLTDQFVIDHKVTGGAEAIK